MQFSKLAKKLTKFMESALIAVTYIVFLNFITASPQIIDAVLRQFKISTF